jgi:hypothetical protein
MMTSRTLIAACCLLLCLAATSGPITVSETAITNNYPESVTFEVEASSTVGDITSVELNLLVRGTGSTTVYVAEFTPGPQVRASVEWKTLQGSVPPGAPAEYTWAIEDEAGNTLETDPAPYIVTDSRFTWQTLEDEDIALWWYAGDAAFGQRVFDAATQALEAMERNTGLLLSYRVHVVLYENREGFDSWHYYPREWVGGEAFPSMGLTVQIIPPRDEEDTYWHTQGMVPHEVAHLFFYQATYHPLSDYPQTWLNEGFAQYHELVSHDQELEWVRRIARSGDLIPLRLATGSFSGDDERIHLLYAESLSAVTFLLERWGEEGMKKLLTSFKEGRSDTNDALIAATGLDFEEFQEAWWEWLGGEIGTYPTPIPTLVVPTFGPPPPESPTAQSPVTPEPTPGVPGPSMCCLPGAGAATLLGLLAFCDWREVVR